MSDLRARLLKLCDDAELFSTTSKRDVISNVRRLALDADPDDRLAEAEAKVRELRDYIDRRGKSGYYDALWRKGEILDDLNALLDGKTAAEVMNPGRAALSGGDAT